MKKALIIFAVIFILTLLVPLTSLIKTQPKKEAPKDELVTIFSSQDSNP